MNPTFKKWEILNINMNNVHIGEENKMKVKKEHYCYWPALSGWLRGSILFELEYSAIRGMWQLWIFLLSALVFAVFWSMVFYKLVIRHTDRIQNYEDELQFFWHFFDKKSFLIMAFMMTFGIGLRASHFAPDVFIAVFYSGLGMALFLAGVLFGVHYFQQERKVSR